MKFLAKLISCLFHPMLMPLLGVFIIFSSGVDAGVLSGEGRKIVYTIVFISSSILPLSLLPLFYQFGVIKSFNMETSRERVIPLFFTALFYYLGYMLLRKIGLSGFISLFLLSTLFVIFIIIVISFFWKISLHTTALGGVTGALLALLLINGSIMVFVVPVILICGGITASARLYLGAHTPAQVYSGYFFGLVAVFSFTTFFY
ncbi:PAP2 family protein [Marinilabiliaceae bacterium ANBcel2]|nr:PAP2 family protein [Marinilabiliaceae bacterium ANBcel2]